MAGSGQDFARAFGDALEAFLKGKAISHGEAAQRLGLGRRGVSRLGTYCHDSPKGTRPTPSAEILYRVCSAFSDFQFAYNGCRISASDLPPNVSGDDRSTHEQLTLPFDRQFYLTDDQGSVSVSVRRPAGQVEVLISLKAIS